MTWRDDVTGLFQTTADSRWRDVMMWQVSPLLVAPSELPRLKDYGEGVDRKGSMMYIANALVRDDVICLRGDDA